MAPSSDSAKPTAASAGKKRVLIMVVAGIAALAAVFFVAKVAMPHSAPSNPIAAVTSAPGKARGVAAASNAAGAKLDTAAGGTTTVAPAAGTTAKTAPAAGGLTGPAPNTTRNPFQP
jgi:hypothetical protein